MRSSQRASLRLPRLVVLLLAGLAIGLVVKVVPAEAQANQWTPRQRIPGIDDTAETPYLVADRTGIIHAFHSMPVDKDESRLAIVYSKWNLEQGWTLPIDILLPPFGGRAVVRGAVLDKEGLIHLIFYSGAQSGGIYYSRALAAKADRATAWSTPELIGESAYESKAAALAGDEQGHLYVVYGGQLNGRGLYAIHSIDGGQIWSEPRIVGLTYDDELFAWEIALDLDQKQQRLHAVWAYNDPNGQGRELFYSGLDTDQMIWSEPFLLVSVEDSQLDAITGPGVVSYGDELFVFYLEWQTPPFRVMRRSSGGELTWTDPIKPFETKGSYGPPNFVIDSNNTLHLILGDRARGLGMWHSVWQGDYWQEPEPIVPLAENQIQEGPLKFHPTLPRTVISRGNVVLVTWTTDTGGATGNGTWYAYRKLDAPELPLIELLTPQAAPTIRPTMTPVPFSTIAVPTLGPDLASQGSAAYEFSTNPATPLIFGFAPVVLLSFAVILVRQQLSHRRR